MSDAVEVRRQRLSELLDQALGLSDPGQRAQWLAALEQQDKGLAAEVARMLADELFVGASFARPPARVVSADRLRMKHERDAGAHSLPYA